MNELAKTRFALKSGELLTRLSQDVTQLKEVISVYNTRGYAPDGTDPIVQEDIQNQDVKGTVEDFHIAMGFVIAMISSIDGGVMANAIDKIRQDY